MLLITSFYFINIIIFINFSRQADIYIDPDNSSPQEIGTQDKPFKSFLSAVKQTQVNQDLKFYFRSRRIIKLDAILNLEEVNATVTFSTYYEGLDKDYANLQMTEAFFISVNKIKAISFVSLNFISLYKNAFAKQYVLSIIDATISFSYCRLILDFSTSYYLTNFIYSKKAKLVVNQSEISIVSKNSEFNSLISLSEAELFLTKTIIFESTFQNASLIKGSELYRNELLIEDCLFKNSFFMENSKLVENIGFIMFSNSSIRENLFSEGSLLLNVKGPVELIYIRNSDFKQNKRKTSSGNPLITLERTDLGGTIVLIDSSFSYNRELNSSFLYAYHFERVIISSVTIEYNTQMSDFIFLKQVLSSKIYNTKCGNNNIREGEAWQSYNSVAMAEGGCLRLNDVLEKKFILCSFTNNSGIDRTAGLFIEDSKNILMKSQTKIKFINCSFTYNVVKYRFVSFIGASIFVDSEQDIDIHCSLITNNQLVPIIDVNVQARPGGPCLYSVNWKSSLYITNSDFIDNNSKHLSSCILFQGTFLTVFNSSFYGNQPIISEIDRQAHMKLSALFPSIYDTLISTLGGAISSLSENVLIIATAFIGNKAFRGAVLFVNGKDGLSVLNIRFISCLILDSEGSKAVVLYFSNKFSSLYYYLDNSIVKRNFATESTLFFGDFGNPGIKTFIANHTYFAENIGEFNVFSQFEVNFMNMTNSIIAFNSAESKRVNYPSCVMINLVCGGTSLHIFSNNTYYGNRATSKVGVLSIWNCKFTTENERYFVNSAQHNAGVIFAFDRGVITITNATFLENSANLNGGCLFISENVSLYIKGSNFLKCRAGIKGGAIYLREVRDVIIEDTIFEGSQAYTGGLISGLDNQIISIKNCSFSKNTAQIELYELKNTLFIMNSSIINNPGYNIFNLESVNCVLNNVKILNSSCKSLFSGCVVSANANSNITLLNTWFDIASSLIVGGGISLSNSTLFLENVLITNMSSAEDASCILALEKSSVMIVYSIFEQFNKYCLYGDDASITINSSVFNMKGTKQNSNPLDYRGAIFCTECSEVFVFNSTFRGGNTVDGGAFKIIYSKNNLTLMWSLFDQNTADSDGGAVYLLNTNTYIGFCIFKNNLAGTSGGALLFISKQQAKYQFYINDTKFENNTAGLEGGAVKWLENQPYVDSCEFIENKAAYGKNLASSPIRFNLKVYSDESQQTEKKLEFDLLTANQSTYELFATLNFVPGNKFAHKLIIQVVDVYGEVVKILNDEVVDIKLVLLSEQTLHKPYLLGATTVKIEQGTFSLDTLLVYSLIGVENALIISIPSIKTFSKEFLEMRGLTPFDLDQEGVYKFKIYVRSTLCPNGSTFDPTILACAKCPFNFVSLDPNIHATCIRCSEGAICPGGAIIHSKSGYWLSSNRTIKPEECPEKEFCQEGPAQSCKSNYQGPLCLGCALNTNKDQFGKCSKCNENKAVMYLQMIGYFIGMNIICTLMIRTAFRNVKKVKALANNSMIIVRQRVNDDKGKNNYKEIKERKIEEINKLVEDYSIYYKILLNYLQLMGIVRSLPIKWPDYFMSFYDSYKIFNIFSIKFVSLGCILEYDLADIKAVEEGKKIPLVFLEGIFVNFIVIVYFLALSLLFYIRSLCDRRNRIGKKIFIGFMILFDMLQPNLIQENAKMFLCIEVEGRYYLQGDVNVSCDSSMYTYLTNIFFLFFLILWTLGIPGTIFYFLRKNRENLNNFKIFSVLGSYYIGYHSNYYYWDFIIMFRENFVIFISMIRFSDNFKIYVVLLLLVNSFYIQLNFKPLIQDRFNNLEELAISVTIVTVISGILYKTGASSELTLLSILLMITLNALFVFLWLKGFFTTIFKKFLAPFFLRKKKFQFFHQFFRRIIRSASRTKTLSQINSKESNIPMSGPTL